MKFKAVLGIKSANGAILKKYRIIDEQRNTRDIPITKIKEVLNKGITIEDLKINNENIEETTEIPKISEVGNRLSLYDWCLQNGERGQRILTEFNTADNFPLTAKDLSASSHKKVKFKCVICNKINIQPVNNKTSTLDNKCKYCSGYEVSDKNSLLSWCKSHKEYRKLLLQEFLDGDNKF